MEKDVDKKSQSALREEAILKFWEENDIFTKTLEKQSPKGEYVFYEGPPTANGKPGIHHIEARVFKDAIPRYKTMQGFHVPRRAGWDTHGLPVELLVEKTLGLKSKKEIEEYGVEEFNKKCKESVLQFIQEFRDFSARIGYWADYNDAYFTFNNSYIESLWGVVGKINERDLIYKDYRIAPWCPRCGTTLSSHELAQGYQDVTDISLYVKFRVCSGLYKDAYILAWTTTPWTLPGNVALAVGHDIDYKIIKVESVDFESGEVKKGDVLVFADNLETEVRLFGDRIRFDGVTCNVNFHGKGNILFVSEGAVVKGSQLVGLSYEPVFPKLKKWFNSNPYNKNYVIENSPNIENGWKVYAAEFVTTDSGTGIVHVAPMFGDDDFRLAKQFNLPRYQTVNEDGTYRHEFAEDNLAGRYIKEKDEAGKPTLDVDIIKYLQENNFYFNKENYKHSYPHCWRCKTPLIYYARDSWYIGMSKLRDELVKENENINWEPDYIKEGRFGEWLREIKDWAISRERYWGTPLPIWTSEDGNKRVVIDSIQALKKYSKKSGNSYKLMRHGKTEKNDLGVWDFVLEGSACLSDEGKEMVRKEAEKLKGEGYAPDYVFVSPYLRTEDTMHIVCDALNIGKERIIDDPRLSEWNVGEGWNGKPIDVFFDAVYKEAGKNFHTFRMPGGESYADVIKRAGEFIYEIDKKYEGKKILIVGHASVLKALFVLQNLPDISKIAEFHNTFPKYKNAEVRDFEFVPLPHNANYEIDLHKPFIDEVVLQDEEGKELKRVKEVMDVWFDSGAMPFAQMGAKKGNRSFEEYSKTVPFPADFISEAIDQTRGWFYTLHAVGVLMQRGNAYKNVICLGHLLDKNGKKMSKSLGNVVDPWVEMNKFGIDAIRLWMYSVNQPGESKNYDEKTVDEVNKKIFNLISNTFTFYELYRDKTLETDEVPKTENVMDLWILDRLNNLVLRITKDMDEYRLLEPVRDMREFVSDLSTWYLQLSRDRFRDGDKGAKQTLYTVLKTLSKLLAPFAPFYAEDLYQKLRIDENVLSVHLESWPEAESKSGAEERSVAMERTRKIVSLGLDARMKADIKVRQPLTTLKVNKTLEIGVQFAALVKERVNIKEVSFADIQNEVELDTEITPTLKEEGIVREIIRAVQDMRKKKGLTPSDPIMLTIGANEKCKDILEKPEWLVQIRDTVLANNIEVKNISEGEKVVVDDVEFTVSLS